jgi:hypothetical protein
MARSRVKSGSRLAQAWRPKTSALFKGISLLIKSTALKIDKKQR